MTVMTAFRGAKQQEIRSKKEIIHDFAAQYQCQKQKLKKGKSTDHSSVSNITVFSAL